MEIAGASSQEVSADDGFTFQTTLEGRVKAQARERSPRRWSVGIGTATPGEIASLLAFASGEWGPGPFVWVSADAPVTNLLTPEVARCGPQALYSAAASLAGPMALGGGQWAGASMTTTDPVGTTWIAGPKAPIPVIPGQPVTVSAYVLGANARVRLHWYRADGTVEPAFVTSQGAGAGGEVRRLHVTATPPAGVVSCTISTTRAAQLTRPAATWTDQLFDWHPGEGCQMAVLHGLSRRTLLALRDPAYGRYSSASFTVTEVG